MSRLKDRMNKVLKGQPAPEQFYFATTAPTLEGGLIDSLEQHVEKHPETELVIIDTLQKVRGQSSPKESAYASDYAQLGTLKSFADRRGISLLIIHHTRKQADSDVHAMISGTFGIMGSVDTSWVITKQSRSSKNAVMSITGRDVSGGDMTITLDPDTMTWRTVGTAEVSPEAAYDSSLIVQAIKVTNLDTCLICNALAIRPLAAGVAAVDRIRPLGGEGFSASFADPILAFFQSPLFQIFLIPPVSAQTIIAIFLGFDQCVEIPSTALTDDFPYNGIWSYPGEFFFIPLLQRFLIFVFPIAVPHGVFPSFHRTGRAKNI